VDVIAQRNRAASRGCNVRHSRGRTQEAEGSLAAMALDAVLKNAELA